MARDFPPIDANLSPRFGSGQEKPHGIPPGEGHRRRGCGRLFSRTDSPFSPAPPSCPADARAPFFSDHCFFADHCARRLGQPRGHLGRHQLPGLVPGRGLVPGGLPGRHRDHVPREGITPHAARPGGGDPVRDVMECLRGDGDRDVSSAGNLCLLDPGLLAFETLRDRGGDALRGASRPERDAGGVSPRLPARPQPRIGRSAPDRRSAQPRVGDRAPDRVPQIQRDHPLRLRPVGAVRG
jgi:hypothetical protein